MEDSKSSRLFFREYKSRFTINNVNEESRSEMTAITLMWLSTYYERLILAATPLVGAGLH